MQILNGLILLLLLVSLPVTAEQTVPELSADMQELSLSRHLVWRPDAPGQWNADDALAWFRQAQLSASGVNYPALGFEPQAIWFYAHFRVNDAAGTWLLHAGRPHMDSLVLSIYDDDGNLVTHQVHGNDIPWSERPYPSNALIFPLALQSGQSYHLLLRAQALGAIEMPVSLRTETNFRLHDTRLQQFSGLYFGAIIVMILFNALLLLAIRDKAYLYYVLYLSALCIYLLSRQGLTFELFWPDHPEINNPLRALAGSCTSAFGLLFALHFLRLPADRPRLAQATYLLAGGMFILAGSAFIDLGLALKFATALPVILIIYALSICAIRIRDGFYPARYFMLSFTPMAILVALFVMKTFSIIDGNWLLDRSIELGSVMEAWLLSFALAHRFTTLRADNERIQRDATIELERRVAERTRELNQALSARSEFLAVMSHEIRTPLNGILGTVDMLKDSPLTDDQQQKIHIIEQSGDALLALINDILDYSRIEAGKLPIEESHFNLPALVRESVALFEHRARLNGNSTSILLDDNLGTLCHGDPVRLRQIIVNLISNAVKFTENGDIYVRGRRDDSNPDYVKIEVEDSGIGIQSAQLPSLFEHFQQADASTSRRFGGAGLGLAICRQLVELMGGEIGVRSQRDKGSCFWFRLPLPAVSAQQAPAKSEAATTPLEKQRLLIVDDNHVNLLVAQGLARKLGHDVETAESGPEAIAILLNDSRPFDLVLMDCEMPDMDGFETSREILRLQKEGRVPSLPVVALTAHAVPDKIRACHEAGMISHIAKPINAEKLDRSLRAVLRPDSNSDDGEAIEDSNHSSGPALKAGQSQ